MAGNEYVFSLGSLIYYVDDYIVAQKVVWCVWNYSEKYRVF